jgi:hypothetical protein
MANTFPNTDQFWKKGQSGNPYGRAKGVKTLKTRLTELMNTIIEYKDLDGKPVKMKGEDALGIALFAKALTTGDTKAIEMIRDELESNQPKDNALTDVQKLIVQRAMERLLPDFTKTKDVTK